MSAYMAAPETERHFTPEILVDYFDHRLSDREEAEIERHIADCERCTALARRVRQVSEVWDNWTANTHAAALEAHPGGSNYRQRRSPKAMRAGRRRNAPVNKRKNG